MATPIVRRWPSSRSVGARRTYATGQSLCGGTGFPVRAMYAFSASLWMRLRASWPGLGYSVGLIHWHGMSGRYGYFIYPIGTTFKDEPGNDIYTEETSTDRWTPLYIGQTSSLKERLAITKKRRAQRGTVPPMCTRTPRVVGKRSAWPRSRI